MKNKTVLNKEEIANEYVKSQIGVEKLANKYHVGKLKIKEILKEFNIDIKKRGGQPLNEKFIIDDPKIKKYVNSNDYHYVVVDKNTDWQSKDIENRGGFITSYIKKQYKIDIPPLYERDKYYKLTGDYWWEQFVSYEKVPNKPTKKCPYCNWETIDTENKGGVFETHLLKAHRIDKITYIKEHPEEKAYFYAVNPIVNLQMEEDTSKYVVCQICGKKLSKIGNVHLKTHGITKEEYISKYGSENLMCDETYNKFKSIAHTLNTTLTPKMKDRFTSSAETEIMSFLTKHNIECGKNRSLLNGQELDIFIPSKNIAIEYNGNVWHTEQFGKKDRNYHLTKLKLCNEHNVKLIQICDDEYLNNKELILNKIAHIVGCDENKPKIFARKTIIREIYKFESDDFLNQYHVQGSARGTVYYGCFYNDKLVGVMIFKNGSIRNKGWELVRFATDYHYICCGTGGKMFKHFLREHKPTEVFSFADRRWTVDIENNIYTKLGFKIEDVLRPDYKYYLHKGGNNKRIHKMSLNKKSLAKKYGFDIRMTESEMANKLGYDRIWDCGLVKYVYNNDGL